MSTGNFHAGLLTFLVADQWLGLNVNELSEVITPQKRMALPLSPGCVNGLINLRGRIITELDLRTIIGLPDRKEEDPYRIIVLEPDGNESFGLVVDGVGEVIDLDAENFEATPDSFSEAWKQVSHGVLKQDGRVVVLIDVEKVLQLSLKEVQRGKVEA